MNKSFFSICIALTFLCACGSNNSSSEEKESVKKKIDVKQLLVKKSADTGEVMTAPLYFTVQPASLNCRIPALQSFVFGQYNGLWIFIGGEKKGFHGTSNNPPPFESKVANDSIWVIDINQQQSWSIAIPSSFSMILGATNSAYCQVGNLLYLCGGFTRNNSSASNFNYTSNNFLEIDLGALIGYVQSGGTSTSFSSVITKQIQSAYVQVTGGALVYNNGFFYLIGGQNYYTTYSSGINGVYTNAIRKFTLQQQQGIWNISDTASLIDTVNLHRRDMNVVPGVPYNDGVILYGGVFTKKDEAFRNAIFINGLSIGNPTIVADTVLQSVNQYTCAFASFGDSLSFQVAVTTFFGGITYKMFDQKSGQLVVGDDGIPMPFSNICSTIATGGGIDNSIEYIQLPPNAPLLPAYMGANAVFIPNPQFSVSNKSSMLDVNKINADTTAQILAGYIFGGIISAGPTSGTTPKGFVPTFANPDVYQVYLNLPGVH